jgi:tetratricopeptide (TPR) repeat protein
MRPRPFHTTCLAAVFLTVAPYTPDHFLNLAKEQLALGDKIALLKVCAQSFPLDNKMRQVREDLVDLLTASNRYEEALQAYDELHPQSDLDLEINFKRMDLELKTGRYADVLRQTSQAPGAVRDFIRDEKLLEYRVQALLAKGQYGMARRSVEHWLDRYQGDGIEGGRFEGDVASIQFLRRHLATLERLQGPQGKPLFTAAAPDSLRHWSHRQNVPVVFFKLIPAHPAGQIHEPLLPGRHEVDDYFEEHVAELNRGFQYISGGAFSLQFKGLHTLYVEQGDLDPSGAMANILTSRVYVHTLPQLYRLAGQAFVVLIDYRVQDDGEAAYMGDGLIHISASKFQPMVVMHEILHGLGATHQDWYALEGKGFRFDPADRGLMTFEKGELHDLGLEEKNRALLGWPEVADIHFSNDAAAAPAKHVLSPS